MPVDDAGIVVCILQPRHICFLSAAAKGDILGWRVLPSGGRVVFGMGEERICIFSLGNGTPLRSWAVHVSWHSLLDIGAQTR